MHFSVSIAKLRLTNCLPACQRQQFLIIYAAVRYNKKLTKLVLRRHDLLNYANLSKQSQLKCCEDAETGCILLS
jgi:hypothetical protein